MIARVKRIYKEHGILEVFKRIGVHVTKILSPFIHFILSPVAYIVIGNRQFKNPESIFDFSISFLSGIIKPIQDKNEFIRLLSVFKKNNPKIILEIGTNFGGTFFCFCKSAPSDAELISVSLPEGSGGYPDWRDRLYKRFGSSNQKIHLIRMDSHNSETINEIKGLLNGRMVDFLFIDGDHSYEGVKMDYQMYSPLVRSGGVIAFHDIEKHPQELECTVDKFWNEVKTGKNYEEIISRKDRPWGGIGVLYV